MRVLVTGRGTSGSWQIRGVQLGHAIGADVIPEVTDGSGYDLAVIVKRATAGILETIRRARVPLVWDVVDAWPQPGGNSWRYDECLKWLREQVGLIRPCALVVSCNAMAADCNFGLPVLVLPHHARPGQVINPIRERVQTVGYEGAQHYLGTWRPLLEDECYRRGWRFICNPGSLSDLDIVVALRDATGYAARTWKSQVKLANAQATGTPCILSPEAAYMENASGAEKWATYPDDIGRAFDELSEQETRREASRRLKAATPRLESIAQKYGEWLRSL